jgi:hypothetical protein
MHIVTKPTEDWRESLGQALDQVAASRPEDESRLVCAFTRLRPDLQRA